MTLAHRHFCDTPLILCSEISLFTPTSHKFLPLLQDSTLGSQCLAQGHWQVGFFQSRGKLLGLVVEGCSSHSVSLLPSAYLLECCSIWIKSHLWDQRLHPLLHPIGQEKVPGLYAVEVVMQTLHYELWVCKYKMSRLQDFLDILQTKQ